MADGPHHQRPGFQPVAYFLNSPPLLGVPTKYLPVTCVDSLSPRPLIFIFFVVYFNSVALRSFTELARNCLDVPKDVIYTNAYLNVARAVLDMNHLLIIRFLCGMVLYRTIF